MEKTRSDPSNGGSNHALQHSLSTGAIDMRNDDVHVQAVGVREINNIISGVSSSSSARGSSSGKLQCVEQKVPASGIPTSRSVDSKNSEPSGVSDKNIDGNMVPKASVHDEAVRDLKKALREEHQRGQNAGNRLQRRNSDPGTQNPTWFGEIATPGGFRRHFVLSKKNEEEITEPSGSRETMDRRRSTSRNTSRNMICSTMIQEGDLFIDNRRSRTSRDVDSDNTSKTVHNKADYVSAEELPPALRPVQTREQQQSMGLVLQQRERGRDRNPAGEQRDHLRHSYQFGTKRQASLKPEYLRANCSGYYLSEKAALLAEVANDETNTALRAEDGVLNQLPSPYTYPLEASPVETSCHLPVPSDVVANDVQKCSSLLQEDAGAAVGGSPAKQGDTATLNQDNELIAETAANRDSTSSSTVNMGNTTPVAGNHSPLTTTDVCEETTARSSCTQQHSGPSSPDRLNAANYEESVEGESPVTVLPLAKKADGLTPTMTSVEETSSGRVFEIRNNFHDNNDFAQSGSALDEHSIADRDLQEVADAGASNVDQHIFIGTNDVASDNNYQEARKGSHGSPRSRTWSANSNNRRNLTSSSRGGRPQDAAHTRGVPEVIGAGVTENTSENKGTNVTAIVHHDKHGAIKTTTSAGNKTSDVVKTTSEEGAKKWSANSQNNRKISHQAHTRSRSRPTGGSRHSSGGRKSGTVRNSRSRYSAFGYSLRGSSTAHGKPKPNVAYAKIPLLAQLWDPQFAFPGVCPAKHKFEDDDSDVDESEKRDVFECPEDIMEKGGVKKSDLHRKKEQKKKKDHRKAEKTAGGESAAITKPLLGKKKKKEQHFYGATEGDATISWEEREHLLDHQRDASLTKTRTKKVKPAKSRLRPDVAADLGDMKTAVTAEDGGAISMHISEESTTIDEVETSTSEGDDVAVEDSDEDESCDDEEDVSEDSELTLDKHGKPHGQASNITTVIVLIKTWLGMNLLVMPHALQNCGLVVGCIVLPTVLCLMLLCTIVLIRLRRHIGVPMTSAEMVGQVLGPRGQTALTWAVVGLQAGFFMFELDQIVATWEGPARRWTGAPDFERKWIVLAVTLCCAPLVLVRKLHYFVYSSFFGMVTMMLAIAYLIYFIYSSVLSPDYLSSTNGHIYPDVWVPARDLLKTEEERKKWDSCTGPFGNEADRLKFLTDPAWHHPSLEGGSFPTLGAYPAPDENKNFMDGYGYVRFSRAEDNTWGWIERGKVESSNSIASTMTGIAHAVFVFACCNTQLPMYESHRDKDNYIKLLSGVVGGVILIFMLTAIPWYLYFSNLTSHRPLGDNLEGVLRPRDQAPRVVSFFLGICGICTQPINYYIIPVTYEPWLFGNMPQGSKRKWLKNLVRVSLVLMMGLLCHLFEAYMPSFLSMVAAICVAPTCAFLPPFLHYKIAKPKGFELWLDWFLMAFGVVAFGISMYSAVHDIWDPHAKVRWIENHSTKFVEKHSD